MFYKKLLICCLLLFVAIASRAQSHSFMYNGISRTYNVHLPPAFTAGDTLPMVLSLHGLTMNSQSQSDLSEFNSIADRERFIVVYPNGINNSWNTFSSPYHSGVDDVGFLSALIDTMRANYHIDLSKVYSTGMSNGGFMSYRLACELSDRIAAIASVTGSTTDSMLFYCSPTRPVPVMHFHGTSDAIVSYTGLGAINSVEVGLQYWVSYNHCPTPPVVTSMQDINLLDFSTAERTYWGLCDDQTEVIHYKITNGGHTWPGSSQTFLGLVGNTNQDIEASELIWEFFSKYSLPQQVTSVPASAVAAENVRIFPNPASDILFVTFTSSNIRLLRLTDLSGKIMMEILPEIAQESAAINVGHLQAGMYLLFSESENSSIVERVLVVRD